MNSRARALRRQATEAEQLLWKHMRGRRSADHKFRRQVLIHPYIIDFVCLEAKLIIEADGGQHMEQIAYDAKRTKILKSMGYKVIRFWNHEMLGYIDAVLEEIQYRLIKIPSPHPSRLGIRTSF